MKKFSFMLALMVLAAFIFAGCANVFNAEEDVKTAVSGKVYRGYHSGETYSLSFSQTKDTVLVTEGTTTTSGSYSLSGSSLTVITNNKKTSMTYDTSKDCIIYDGSTLK